MTALKDSLRPDLSSETTSRWGARGRHSVTGRRQLESFVLVMSTDVESNNSSSIIPVRMLRVAFAVSHRLCARRLSRHKVSRSSVWIVSRRG